MVDDNKKNLNSIPKRMGRKTLSKSQTISDKEKVEKVEIEEITNNSEKNNQKTEQKTLRKIRQEMQYKFIGCFLLGVLLIVLFQDYFWGLVPLLAMFLYLVIGFSSLKIIAAKAVFADSFYYLGFLFTFASLLFAISGENSNFASVISQMGTALSTTVVGMLIRILISHFDPIETEVNNAVSDEMANMATQIRRLTEELTKSIQEQLNAMITISSASEKQLNSINQALEKISNIDTPQESLTRFEETISSLSNKLEDLVNNAGNAQQTLQNFSESTNSVASALSASGQIVIDSQTTSQAMNNMSGQMEVMTANLTSSISTQLEDMREMSSASNLQLVSMNKALEKIAAINISQDNLQNFNSNISELSNKLNNLIANTSNAEDQLVKFATSTSAVSSALASSARIVKDTETTAKRLDALQNDLESIVSSASNEKTKLTLAVSEISKQIMDAKKVINRTSELSLQMEKNIEDRMANILKLVRNS